MTPIIDTTKDILIKLSDKWEVGKEIYVDVFYVDVFGNYIMNMFEVVEVRDTIEQTYFKPITNDRRTIEKQKKEEAIILELLKRNRLRLLTGETRMTIKGEPNGN